MKPAQNQARHVAVSLIAVEAHIPAFPHAPDQERKGGSILAGREASGAKKDKSHPSMPRLDLRIRLESPRGILGQHKGQYVMIIPLNNDAVSTSGDYERYFDDKKEYHHIINPETGYSATELISLTIVTDNAFDADALSTTVFVLGKEKGMELIEFLPNVEGLIITREKEILRSSGFKEK